MRRFLSGLSEAQERVERTPAGQGLISGLIVTAVLTGIVWNLPASAIKRQAMTVISPIGSSTGLGQAWDVFAPNPPRQQDYVTVVVTFADGHDTVWTMPHGDPLVGHYSTERWHKIREYLMKTPSLRAPFARWVARDVGGPNGGAVRVRIEVRTVTLPPPGSAAVPRTTRRVLYDEKLAGS